MRSGAFSGVAVVVIERGAKDYAILTPENTEGNEEIRVICPSNRVYRMRDRKT
jgi:hypothetical protein